MVVVVLVAVVVLVLLVVADSIGFRGCPVLVDK